MVAFDPVILSRIQFAVTLSFHILFPTLTIGLAGYLLFWEVAWLKTEKNYYYQLCRFWTKIFALGFGIGVVSGLVLSYEFGTNFSRFSEAAGNVVGPLMSYEVLTAFFLEAGFLGIMLFGWGRVSKGLHLFSTLMVALGAMLSAFWILSANSWMQTPAGFRIENGVFFVTSWWDVIFNPSFPYRFCHMVIAAYLTTSVLICGISAWYLLHKRNEQFARSTFSLSLIMVLVLGVLQLFVGDLHGLNTVKYQPLKIAAIEARWDTQSGAPLTLVAYPDMQEEKDLYAVDVPKLGSLILRHSVNAEIVGLKSFPAADRPYVPIVFYAFRIMVGIGMLFILTGFVGLYLRFRGRLYYSSFFFRWCVLISPFGFIAVLAGWFTTEVGRQPWVVYGLMRTRDAASLLPPGSVLSSLIAFICLYLLLLTVFLWYVVKLIHKGPDEKPIKAEPGKLTAWLEEKPHEP